MPDFRSNLLNKSSQAKRKEDKKEETTKNSNNNMALKKFKSFREQPVTIMIDPLEFRNKPNLDANDVTSRRSNFNMSSKSGLKSGFGEADEFESASDSEAMEIKAGDLKKVSSTKILSVNPPIIASKFQPLNVVNKKATIQEVSEDKELNDTPLLSVVPASTNIEKFEKKEFSKITEEAKDADDGEGIEFESSQEIDSDKENQKKPLMMPSSTDENKLLKKSLEEQKQETVVDAVQVGWLC